MARVLHCTPRYTLSAICTHFTLIQNWSIGITTQQKNIFYKMWSKSGLHGPSLVPNVWSRPEDGIQDKFGWCRNDGWLDFVQGRRKDTHFLFYIQHLFFKLCWTLNLQTCIAKSILLSKFTLIPKFFETDVLTSWCPVDLTGAGMTNSATLSLRSFRWFINYPQAFVSEQTIS